MPARNAQRRFAAILGDLDIPQPFDLSQFLASLALQRQRMIFLHPFTSGPGVPCGVWLATARADHIFHESGTTAWHATQIVLHEIAHMLLGHRERAQSSRGLASLLAPDLDQALIQLILGRSAYATAEEQDAETLASLIVQRATAAAHSGTVAGGGAAARGGIASLVRRSIRRVRLGHIRCGMRVIASAAGAQLALLPAWLSVIVSATEGRQVTRLGTSVVALVLGIVMLQFTVAAGAVLCAPALRLAAWHGQMWAAHWRLRQLWLVLSSAAPDVRLPLQPGTRFNVGYRLHRRVIEIHDAELALRPYWGRDITGQQPRSAHLAGDGRAAAVEAARIMATLGAQLRGVLAHEDIRVGPVTGNDLADETARLIRASKAVRPSLTMATRAGIRFGKAHRPFAVAFLPRRA